MMKSPPSTFCIGVIFHALFVNFVGGSLQQSSTQSYNRKGHAERIIADQCPAGWTYYGKTEKCFEAFTGPLTHAGAQDYCSEQGGNLAMVTDDELDYVIRQNWEVDSPYWMGYILQRDSNSSDWEELVPDVPVGMKRSQGLANSNIAMPSAIPPNIADHLQLCLALDVQRGIYFYLWQWQLHPCNITLGAFLCDRAPTQPCIDRKGNLVGEGDRYKPQGYDPCMECTCHNREQSMCVQTQCGQPRCQNYLRDPEVCCGYTCLSDDGSNPQKGIDVTDNMRWVLTMLTSFILLGMMLFMVYRMRQKRMAYLRYRAQQLRDGGMMDFEPGSGPPPPPNLDDIDGAGYREPPPPYSFFKVDLPTECPPPYEPTPIAFPLHHPPDVNRNHRSSGDSQGEETALLASGNSEPTTPTVVSEESVDPPSYTPSTPYIANSDGPSPDTERSIISAADTEDIQEPETPETPGFPSSPVTLLPSTHTTV
ncbi:integral membrane protein DGCR2/IDD-like [Amphiura filiformis]|uniref:integral membrane protein DGCR2/IDD-like n=1 Tax=Amphiura filiformis TaxID=82378 RepID=UPI003B22860F